VGIRGVSACLSSRDDALQTSSTVSFRQFSRLHELHMIIALAGSIFFFGFIILHTLAGVHLEHHEFGMTSMCTLKENSWNHGKLVYIQI